MIYVIKYDLPLTVMDPRPQLNGHMGAFGAKYREQV